MHGRAATTVPLPAHRAGLYSPTGFTPCMLYKPTARCHHTAKHSCLTVLLHSSSMHRATQRTNSQNNLATCQCLGNAAVCSVHLAQKAGAPTGSHSCCLQQLQNPFGPNPRVRQGVKLTPPPFCMLNSMGCLQGAPFPRPSNCPPARCVTHLERPPLSAAGPCWSSHGVAGYSGLG